LSTEEQAQVLELKEWERINQSRGEVVKYSPGDEGYGPEYCSEDECGVEMPTPRREWGFAICVGCQTLVEQQQAQYRR
jgi:RNA polymerase-binding transcription factor DksA